VAAVHVLARRALKLEHPKLTTHVVDFTALPALPAIDETYLALGTTIQVAGSQSAFRAVDFDANLAVAVAAQVAGARRLGLVSAMGADSRSVVFYNRVKGELEAAIQGLGYEGIVIARPSLLIGDRTALGQPTRRAERIGTHVARWMGPLLPDSIRPIAARDVAAALLRTVPVAHAAQVLTSDQMQSNSQGS
jgi:uncharacterized protein YbjT (DUF2867 family)